MTYYDTDRSDEFAFGNWRSTANIVGICVHDTEGVTSAQANDETDDNVTTYQCNSQTGSYHVMVGVDGERIRQNTDDWATWSTGNKGNDILLHICFVGSARQTRAQWLEQDTMLRAGATVIRHWSDAYGIPLRRVNASTLPGVLGHADTRVWGGTDHTDPGDQFPYDRLLELAQGKDDDMAFTDEDRAMLRDVWTQLRGPGGKGWPQLGTNDAGQNLTPVDKLAAIGDDVYVVRDELEARP